MKKILFLIILALITQSAIAASHIKMPDTLILKMNMLYNAQNKQGLPIQRHLQNTYRLKTHDQHWTTLNAMNSRITQENTQVFLLQGKVKSATNKAATIQFLVFDLNDQSSAVLTPTIKVRYGQEGKIEIHEKHRDLQLTLIVKR